MTVLKWVSAILAFTLRVRLSGGIVPTDAWFGCQIVVSLDSQVLNVRTTHHDPTMWIMTSSGSTRDIVLRNNQYPE